MGSVVAISCFANEPLLVADPAAPLDKTWTHQRFGIATEYQASARIPEGSIVASPYHPGTTRSIVVRSGEKQLGQWLRESRNVISDFRRAFGREPPETVEVIALFTDNDQTRELVETYYGAVRAQPR